MKRFCMVLGGLAICLMSGWPVNVTVVAGQTGQSLSLFNGRDLSGWVNVNGAADTWQVREGVLICTGNPRCFLRTDRPFDNYVLELEWRLTSAKGNSGLFIHATALPQVGAPYPEAIEAQIHDGDHGSLFGIRGASLIPVTRPDLKGHTARARALEERCRPVGRWNRYKLISRNGEVELAVNGKTVTHAWRTSRRAGYIALQSEHSRVEFRNIRLKPLPGSRLSSAHLTKGDNDYVSLTDGRSLAKWNLLPGHRGHWTIRDGLIHYDGKATGKRTDRDLWTRESFGDFELVADWRLPVKPTLKPHPIVLPNGDFDRGVRGKRKTFLHLDAGDSGIYLRGNSRAQINVWSQELGSGEINGYRVDRKQPPDVRRACLPSESADKPLGQWNRFVITMRGERVTVVLNGRTVIHNARLPGVAASGPIALQHHWDPVEFRNLFIRKLGSADLKR